MVERQAARPFVGREQSLVELRELWAESLDGRRRVAVIEGEAGVGKTRLAAQFAAEAHARGAIVLWGRATAEAIVPYESMVEALRTVLRSVSDEARTRVLDGRRGLGILVPFVGDADDGRAAAPELGTDRYVLFETVAELLEAESAMHPILFVLDDVQYVDGLTFRLLAHLLRHERPGRLMIIGTVRTMPPVDNPHADGFMADLRRDGTLHNIDPGRPRRGRGRRAARRQWQRDPGVEGGRRAAGNARQRVLRQRAGRARRRRHHARVGPRRAERAPRPAADRVESPGDLCGRRRHQRHDAGPRQATGLDADEFLDAVDETLDAGVLAEDPTTGVFSFRHALVEQVVLDRISQTRRATMHLSIADAIEAVGGSPLELAHHLLAAGRLARPNRTVLAAVGAGRRALDVLAYEDGLVWAQRALGVDGTHRAAVAVRGAAAALRRAASAGRPSSGAHRRRSGRRRSAAHRRSADAGPGGRGGRPGARRDRLRLRHRGRQPGRVAQ